MKSNKNIFRYLLGVFIGIIIVAGVSVYAVEAVINSREVSYDNKESHGSYENVQGSIDELYERSGIMKNKWVDPILNGADPVFDEDGELIPVEIDGNGKVKYANLYTEWYKYEEKRWANAVILVDSPSKSYKTGDTIAEEDIESYFVWIPRYRYKIWDTGNYSTAQDFASLKDSTNDAAAGEETALRRITSNARIIEVIFETKSVNASTTQTVNSYYTHPAFITLNVNGLWVGKFETGYNQMSTVGGPITISNWNKIGAEKDAIDGNRIIVKSNVYSWRNQTLGKMFKTALEYESGLGSHMMKNTEWGAVAYLSHSVYGIGTEVNINNNSEYKTGYSAASNTDQSTYPGTSGTGTDVTQPWNTSTGYLASTTGNITGVYDMSGGAHEYMAAYMEGQTGASELTVNELTSVDYSKYLDRYSNNNSVTLYNKRILGDATGEMGPFYQYHDKDKNLRNHNAWYADRSDFIESVYPFFNRGSLFTDGAVAGQFSFGHYTGDNLDAIGSRLVLSVN